MQNLLKFVMQITFWVHWFYQISKGWKMVETDCFSNVLLFIFHLQGVHSVHMRC